MRRLPDSGLGGKGLMIYRGLVKGVAKAPEIAEEDLNIMFATNVTGLINMTQAVLPIFKKRADGGAGDIINIGSIAGREPYIGGSIYCATKAAIRSFTDSLRKELVSTRIRIIEIDPGQVETVSLEAGPSKWKHTNIFRTFLLFGFMVINPRLMQFMRTCSIIFLPGVLLTIHSGCEPLTPDDIAEVIVFAAGRRENVVLADTLIFPNHQVCLHLIMSSHQSSEDEAYGSRPLQPLYTKNHRCAISRAITRSPNIVRIDVDNEVIQNPLIALANVLLSSLFGNLSQCLKYA